MRKNYFKWIAVALCVATSLSVSAYDFTVDDIYYTITGTATVSVSNSGSTNSYSGDVVIPSTVTDDDGNTYFVTALDDSAFRSSTSLTSVTIPNGIITIGEWCFTSCSKLTSVTLPNSVTTVGIRCFQACTGLTSLTLSESLTEIPNYFCVGCTALEAIEIPASVTSIGDRAFSYLNAGSSGSSCKALTTLTFADDSQLESIGTYAFANARVLKSVDLPNSVSTIGTYAFQYCYALESIEFPEGNSEFTEIPNYCCSGCTLLTAVEIPETVTTIGQSAFAGNSATAHMNLESVTIPSKVTSIGTRAFQYNTLITSIIIPKRVTSIGSQAFIGCTALTEVSSVSATPPILGAEDVFDEDTYSSATLYVPTGALSDYQATTYENDEGEEVGNYWYLFTTITEDDNVGISNLASDGRTVVGERYYNLAGQEVASPSDSDKAIYIVVRSYDDGTTVATKEAR